MTHEFSKESIVPLCVDLDGTLIHTDVLWEGIKFLLRRKPLALLWMLPSLRGGRAPFKKAVSAKSTVSVDSLPWRESLVSWLRSEAANGRPIYLVTAADSAYAQAVCERLGFFAGALSSDGAGWWKHSGELVLTTSAMHAQIFRCGAPPDAESA